MNPRDIEKAEKQLKHLQNIPLTGPELDDAFYVFAVLVNSESSIDTGIRHRHTSLPEYINLFCFAQPWNPIGKPRLTIPVP